MRVRITAFLQRKADLGSNPCRALWLKVSSQYKHLLVQANSADALVAVCHEQMAVTLKILSADRPQLVYSDILDTQNRDIPALLFHVFYQTCFLLLIA